MAIRLAPPLGCWMQNLRLRLKATIALKVFGVMAGLRLGCARASCRSNALGAAVGVPSG